MLNFHQKNLPPDKLVYLERQHIHSSKNIQQISPNLHTKNITSLCISQISDHEVRNISTANCAVIRALIKTHTHKLCLACTSIELT